MTTSYNAIAHGLLRIVSGLLFLFHGLVKIFGFPPGVQPGQVPPLSLMGVGGAIELVCGTLIMIGLFSRTAAFIASGQMAVAYWMFHAPQGLYPVGNMGDGAILYCFIFLFIAAAGPGAWSVDGLRRGRGGSA